MKLSEKWLREWVNPKASIEEIAERLVMGGLELEIEPVVREMPTGVVVGKIESLEPHPDAERLVVCTVNAGGGMHVSIVCGAPNARAGMMVPVALPGAKLAGGMEIKKAKLRGVESSGMLCSASELGLTEQSDGLLELDPDAVPGRQIKAHLELDDNILNLEITPNRGDCLSVVGLAREVAALFDVQMRRPTTRPATVVGVHRHQVEVEDARDCPNYAGRVVYGLAARARTPDYMRERLRRSGIRSLYPLVDITNYVMLEMGQPMHAFDGARLSGTVKVRRAKRGETLTLLNDQKLQLDHQELLICDDSGPVALAGVMGGASTAVSSSSARVFFESACFGMDAVAGTGRRHKISTDALHRFERGVDPDLQRAALERATELTSQICGGDAGPISSCGRSSAEIVSIRLRHARINKLLGHDIPARDVEALLARLAINTRNEVGGTWSAQIPSWRYDLRIEADLIEEVARLYGYDKIPAKPYAAHMAPGRPSETVLSASLIKQGMVARGWQEVISLAFNDQALQHHLNPLAESVALDNPLADNLGVMRSTLWCGLIEAWQFNHARQAGRLRLFESGVCFERASGKIYEMPRIGGICSGPALPEQWGSEQRPADFYDVKADVVALFGADPSLRFEAVAHAALHPGRSARISRRNQPVGWMGELHPGLVAELDLPSSAIVFELDWNAVSSAAVPKARPVPEYPASRRDISLVVPETVEAEVLCQAVRELGPESLKEVVLFDMYRGENLGNTFKSLALGLIFQDYSRTLTVEDVDSAVTGIKSEVAARFGATERI